MYLIILAIILWLTISSVRNASAERKRKEEIARINAANAKHQAEQAWLREQMHRRQAERKAEAERINAMRIEQAILKAQTMQNSVNIERHEAWLRKHDVKIERCEDTIAHHSELLEVYSARLENAENELEAVSDKLLVLNITLDKASKSDVPIPVWQIEEMSKESQKLKRQKEQLENKVISLKNQKFSTEQKIKKAEADKAEAERKIA